MKAAEAIKRTLGVTALGLALSTSAVYAQGSTASGANQGPNAVTKSSSTDLSSTSGSSALQSGSADKVAASDRKMMQDLAEANMAEIAVAKLAKDKSKDDQVQSYAQTLIDDHTDASKKLQDLAQKKDVKLPDQPDSKQQAEKKKLESLSGDKFDREFLQQAGVKDHRNTHDLLVKIQKQAKDQDFIHLASNLIPVIDGHLDKALKLTGPNSAATTTGTSSKAASGSAAMTGRPGANNVDLGASGSSSGGSGNTGATGSSR